MNPSTSPERQDVINMTIDTIGKDMLSAMVDELRNQQDVWQKLSEDKQGEVIERLAKRVKSNVQTAVHLIASNGNHTIVADLEQVVIKDGVKAVFNVGMGNSAIEDIFNGVGKPFLLSVSRASEFISGMDEVQPDPDQYELNDGDGAFVDVTEDDNVIDGDTLNIEQQPLQSELLKAFDDGYKSAAAGFPDENCPVYEQWDDILKAEWIKGWKQWHEEHGTTDTAA